MINVYKHFRKDLIPTKILDTFGLTPEPRHFSEIKSCPCFLYYFWY